MSKPTDEEVYHAAERILEHFGSLNTRRRAAMLAGYFEWHESEAYYWRVTDGVEREADIHNEIDYWNQHREL